MISQVSSINKHSTVRPCKWLVINPGAVAVGQAEELEGADVNFYPDGVAGLGVGGIAAANPDSGTPIENTDAETRELSGSEIDDLTGFILYPGEATASYKGWLSRKKSSDQEPFRESLKHRSVTISAAKFTEQDDNFLVDSVAPEDL